MRYLENMCHKMNEMMNVYSYLANLGSYSSLIGSNSMPHLIFFVVVISSVTNAIANIVFVLWGFFHRLIIVIFYIYSLSVYMCNSGSPWLL